MPDLPISPRNAAAASSVNGARRAVWLVLGWVAFWLGTAVYPCQAHHALPVIGDVATAMAVSSGTNSNLDHLDSSPAHQDRTCQELTAPAIGSPGAVVATAGTLNPDPPAPAAFDVKRLPPAVHAFNAYPASHPPPHTPLFLTTQRLLI